MTKSTGKATRKFESRHLKDTLERRKAGAKIKQRAQIKAKRQERKVEDAEFLGTKDGGAAQRNGAPSKEDKALQEMTVDDFFQSGFEIPEDSKKSKSKAAQDSARKRKRDQPEEENDEDSDESIDEAQAFEGSDDDLGSEDEGGMSKEAMDALAKKDPEFYKYLQENDPEALKFDEDLAEVDGLSESDTEEKPKKKRKSAKAEDNEDEDEEESGSEVTKEMVAKWKAAMSTQNSLRAMRQVVLAFRAAAHINEDNEKEYKYTMSNSEAYHQLLMTSLELVPVVLAHHLPIKENAAGKVRVPTDSKKFKTLTPLLKSHTAAVLHLLSNLSDAPTMKATLSSLTALLPFMLPFRKALKGVVKTVADIWSDTTNTEATRITAFLTLRRLVVIGDAGLREAVLKVVYQGLIQGSRNTTVHTVQGINLMKNSAAELWAIDESVGYNTGFASIRQLAIHLRSSITNTTKESYKTVYNWQYVHSLDFWSVVLSEHCSAIKEAMNGKESQLRPLIYPLVQVTLGALRLIPTAIYFPLRFQLVRSLLRLSRATGTYIPLAPALLEVISSVELKKPSKPSTMKALDFNISYKAPKSYLHTRVYQDGIGEQLVELLSEFFVLWSTNIAFPELALPVIVMLKRWLKDVSSHVKGNKNNKLNGSFVLLIQKLETNGKWIEEKRAKVDFAPRSRSGVENFLKGVPWEQSPLGAFVVGQRKQREEKTRLIEESRRQEEEAKKAEKEAEKAALKEDDETADSESEDEEDVEMDDAEESD